MQKVDLPTSFTKLNENCGLPDIFTDYQIRHLGNPSGLPDILLKIDPWRVTSYTCRNLKSSIDNVRQLCDMHDISFLHETWLSNDDLSLLKCLHADFYALCVGHGHY